MNISPAIIIDVALIAVIVVSVFHYARKGFVAGLMEHRYDDHRDERDVDDDCR